MTLLDHPRPPARPPRPGPEGLGPQVRPRGFSDFWQALRRWESGATDRLLLGGLVVVALVLRVPRLGIKYWGDEAIAVGIAGRPIHEIPHYLGFDGSPPLWYLLLHFWMDAFGRSEVATHTFSLLVSLAAIPLAWWCADTLFPSPRRRAARAAALLAAVSPYLAYYGTETRMYALLGVLSMVAVTAFVRGYQEPEVSRNHRGAGWQAAPAGRWMGLAVITSVAVLYTHNWGLFLVGFLAVTGALAAWLREDRVRLRRVGWYGVAVSVGYLPWVPNFVSQLRTTGAPWAPRPHLIDLIVDPFNVSCSAAWFVVLAGIGVAVAVRGRSAGWFFPRSRDALVSKDTMASKDAMASKDIRAQDPTERPFVERRWGWTASSPLGLGAVMVVGTVLVGWTASQFVHAWAPRYLGVAVVPALVILGGLFAEHAIGRRCLLVVAASLAATSLPVLFHPSAFADSKSNVAAVDRTMRAQLAPGDLVVTTALAELPVIAYYLPAGLRYATPLGVVTDPRVVDWQHLPTRLQEAVPATDLSAVLASVPVGGHVLVVNPLTFASTETPAQYAGTVKAEGVAVNQDILLDPRFQAVRTVKPHDPGAIANPVVGTLYLRIG